MNMEEKDNTLFDDDDEAFRQFLELLLKKTQRPRLSETELQQYQKRVSEVEAMAEEFAQRHRELKVGVQKETITENPPMTIIEVHLQSFSIGKGELTALSKVLQYCSGFAISHGYREDRGEVDFNI